MGAVAAASESLQRGSARRHVVLLGSTASGKSAAAFELALAQPDVELVSIDSMAVYRHMDIGTAKPTPDQRRRVPHHLIDLVEPGEEFSLGDFQVAARAAIAEIEARGGRALLVAGTALYLRAVIDELELPGRWPELARRLEQEARRPGGPELLHRRLEELDPLAASRIEPRNARRTVRALEVTTGSGRRFSSFGPGLDNHAETRFVLLGVPFVPQIHDPRIEARLDAMLREGLLEEVRSLAERKDGLSRTARQALGYRELLSHVEDGTSYEQAVQDALTRTKSFARRQWRWFRRDPRVQWLDPSSDLSSQLSHQLSRDSCSPLAEVGGGVR